MWRRIAFVVLIFPVMIYAFLRWIVTDQDPLQIVEDFARWRDA